MRKPASSSADRYRPTIHQVARAAGVSAQTVSRVLNNRPDVSVETFERVKRVIAELGYAPNLMARGLTQGHSRTIGVVAFGLEYFGPSQVLTGIERRAGTMGYAITLNLIHESELDGVNDLFASLLGRQVDGIIWAIPEVGANRLWTRERAGSSVPLVLVGAGTPAGGMPSVAIDNYAIGCVATRHLLEAGARRPGIITGLLDWFEARERLRGWRDALAAHGMDADDRLMVAGDWSPNSGERGLHRLVEQSPDLDAVFASNDQMALGALHAAHSLGRRVPDGLSVIGVDNIPEGSHLWPPLTTVDQPLRDAGALAVERVVRMIRAARPAAGDRPPAGDRLAELPDEPEEVVLQPALILRGSTRVAAAGGEPSPPAVSTAGPAA